MEMNPNSVNELLPHIGKESNMLHLRQQMPEAKIAAFLREVSLWEQQMVKASQKTQLFHWSLKRKVRSK